MASSVRSRKYLSLPTDFFSGKSFRRLRRMFRVKNGISLSDVMLVYFFIELQIAAGEFGYYIELNDDFAEDCADVLDLSPEVITEAIQALVSVSLFDSSLFNDKILTSLSIQENFNATMARLKRNARVQEYCLLESDGSTEESSHSTEESNHSSEESDDSTEESDDSTEESGHSTEECGRKVKYSNVKYSNVKYSNVSVLVGSELSLEDIESYYFLKNHKNWMQLAKNYFQSRTSTGWVDGAQRKIVEKWIDMERYETNCQDKEPLFKLAAADSILKALFGVLVDAGTPHLLCDIKGLKESEDKSCRQLVITTSIACRDALESKIESLKRNLYPIGIKRVSYLETS